MEKIAHTIKDDNEIEGELKSPNPYSYSDFYKTNRDDVVSDINKTIGIDSNSLDNQSAYFKNVFDRLSTNQLIKIYSDIKEYKELIIPALSEKPRDIVNDVFRKIISKYARERILNEKIFCTSRFGELPNKEYVKGLFFDSIKGHNESPSVFIDKMNSCARISGDLNGLKAVNDLISHEAGDLYLKAFAESFKNAVNEISKIEEYKNLDLIPTSEGGDEFGVMIVDKNGNKIKRNFIYDISSKLQNIIENDPSLIMILNNFDFSKKIILINLFGENVFKRYEKYKNKENHSHEKIFDVIEYFATGKFKLPPKVAFGGFALGDFFADYMKKWEEFKNEPTDVSEDYKKMFDICKKINSGNYSLNIEDISNAIGVYFDVCDNEMILEKDNFKNELKDSSDVFHNGLRFVYARNKDQRDLQMIVDKLVHKKIDTGKMAYVCPKCDSVVA